MTFIIKIKYNIFHVEIPDEFIANLNLNIYKIFSHPFKDQPRNKQKI